MEDWNPRLCTFNPFKTCDGILLEGKVHGIKKSVDFMNMYAPYKDQRSFWDKFDDSHLLSLENLVIVRNLNLTLHSFENWGTTPPIDPLFDYFLDLFKKHRLVDIFPTKLSHTWKRKKKGGEGVGKRLDRFFMKDSLLDHYLKYRSCVIHTHLSDCFPIALQFEEEPLDLNIPFKFDHSWLKNQDFC